jgi:hypothetical protein
MPIIKRATSLSSGIQWSPSPNSRGTSEPPATRPRLTRWTIIEHELGRNGADQERNPKWSLIEPHSSTDDQALAAKARRLLADVTTPRLKQYLEQIIKKSEQIEPRR